MVAVKKVYWTEAEDELLRSLCAMGLDAPALVRALAERGVARSQSSVEHRRDRLKLFAQVQPSAVVVGQPLTMTGDALLLFDVHAPFHDADWLNRCIELALRWKVNQVGIGGDLIDLAAFSPYGRDAEVEAEDEIRATEQILSALTASFATVYYVGGNHEVRLARQLGCALDLERIMTLWVHGERVTVSDYHWFRLVSGDETYLIEHPRNASMHATIVPKALCAKFGCNVVAGHGHQWGITRDVSGRYWAVDAGICADPRRLRYAEMEHSTRPVMLQGAVIVKEGLPVLLCPQNIGFYLGR